MKNSSIDWEFVETLTGTGEGGTFLWPDHEASARDIQVAFKIEWLQKISPKYLVEIGTHRAHFCYLCKLTIPDIKIVTLDIEDRQENVTKVNTYFHTEDISFKQGPSHTTLEDKSILELPLDAAYVDGDHSYEGALGDITRCANLGIPHILIDDTTLIPPVTQAVEAFLSLPDCQYVISGKAPKEDVRGTIALEKVT